MVVLMTGPYPKPGELIKGGVETVCVNLVEALSKQAGVIIHFVAFHSHSETFLTREQVNPNLTIHHFSERGMRNKRAFYFGKGRKLFRKLLGELLPDVVHFQGNGPHLLLSKVIPREKLVLTRHGNIAAEMRLQPTFAGKLIYMINLAIERTYVPRIRYEIAISKYNRSLIKKVQNKDIRVIPNPVNRKLTHAGGTSDMGQKGLLFVGSVSRLKGLLDLVRAVALSKSKNIIFDLTVAGPVIDKEYHDEVLSLIRKSGLEQNVIFCGSKSTSELSKLYTSSFLFILPSHQESAPMVIAEAQVSRAAVIATRVGGVPEMIKNGENGFLYEKGDVNELSRLLDLCYSHPEKLIPIRQMAWESAFSSYHPDVVARQTLDFYKELSGS
jgi:glycosyltransferase involved in cell wall biosynthesis